MGFFSVFFAVLQIAPMIIGLVKQVESAMPGKGLGAKKLDLVLGIVNAAAQAEPAIHQAIAEQDLKTAVTGIVNTTVSTLNAAGVFAK